MSLVRYPLENCIARPKDEHERNYPLIDHLLMVGRSMGDPKGDYNSRLSFLSGLLHDVGKARTKWQDYIRLPEEERRKKTVPHAFAGSMLFALMFDLLLQTWPLTKREKEVLYHYGLSLIYFVYNHHGKVPDLIEPFPPWQAEFSPEDLIEADLDGLTRLIISYFPELGYLKTNLDLEFLCDHFKSISTSWSNWQNKALSYVSRIQRDGNLYVQSARMYLLNNVQNNQLIAGDRLHAAGFESVEHGEDSIPTQRAAEILEQIAVFCTIRRRELITEGSNKLLLEKRESCREAALENFHKSRSNRLFTLELPTGYGKTLTSLSVALDAVARGLSRRIIYVAPYISILSQAANEIGNATGLEVLVHHHMSSLEGNFENNSGSDENIPSESWLAPVTCTTYNQFFRAIFPARSQHTLRLSGLKDAFVIIDEPQTIASASWSPFLTLLETVTQELNCQVLFTTATMPELEGCLLESECLSLGREIPLFNRYLVETLGRLDEESLSKKVVDVFETNPSVAVIMNTIKDAALVYKRVKEKLDTSQDINLYFLSGQLTPLHKKQRIEEIKEALKAKKPVIVVCTQVLEAGVDLSFRLVFRALPLIPSIIQAAGRCNRHGEKDRPGILYLFDFHRGGEEDTRRYVYRNSVQREVTDLCLQKYPGFEEMQSVDVVKEYYHECFKRNDSLAMLRLIEDAAIGNSSDLAELEPFGSENIFEYGIYVPLLYGVPPKMIAQAFRYFGVSGPEELWGLYVKRGFLASLNFVDHKRFMSLISQFIVQVSEIVAREIGERFPGRTVMRLRYPSLYKDDIGLSLLDITTSYDEQFI